MAERPPSDNNPEMNAMVAECEANSSQPDLLGYLSSAYEVLRKVFSFLHLDDLINAAEAFESWRTVAEVTRKERTTIESFVVSYEKYKMSKIWSEAVFCICFCTAPNKELEEKVAKYISPLGEFLLCLSGAGVIGTMNDLSQIVQQKVRVGMSVAPKRRFYLTTLRIPQMDKVGIKTMVWEENMDFRQFRSSFDIPDDKIVKCLLVLMVTEGNGRTATRQKDDFINFLQSRQKESFAIGGCVIDNFVNYSRANPSNSVTKYIIFYGENVEAASTVLTADVKSFTRINNKIKRLKEMCPVTDKGALFVFRCAGRQGFIRRYKLKHDIPKWEGETIQKHFPKTPVVGCFGYGEFGREHPYNHVLSSNKRMKPTENWEFSFSTSVVYVGFKK